MRCLAARLDPRCLPQSARPHPRCHGAERVLGLLPVVLCACCRAVSQLHAEGCCLVLPHLPSEMVLRTAHLAVPGEAVMIPLLDPCCRRELQHDLHDSCPVCRGELLAAYCHSHSPRPGKLLVDSHADEPDASVVTAHACLHQDCDPLQAAQKDQSLAVQQMGTGC